MRLAIWGPELGGEGPGLLYRDVLSGKNARIDASLAQIVQLAPDVLLLIGVDWDGQQAAAHALREALAARDAHYPYLVHRQPNSGLPSGEDLDGNGVYGEARDAQGYGRFTGAGGVLLLSKLPVIAVEDMSAMLWRDLAGGLADGAELSPGALAVQRLSSSVHWIVRLEGLELLIWSATPPIFDGPEDRNGRRNHDETAFWLPYLATLPADPPLVMLGRANLDPAQKEGRKAALETLLSSPRLQDPLPDLPTADLGGKHLRLDYILPDHLLEVTGAGVLPATEGARYRMVWVDIAWPCACSRGD
ncbi:endonuclease/exonuclease/phosphatase family protein [Thioclava kandeliae]|uniref:Endonuclease/exonuclease/phosphatase family protein n=1 Tax=Thioclava kandeliae TaxID=3070818 RepID=A0ABV1SHR0_9RHOB